jgi:hypothetical protein
VSGDEPFDPPAERAEVVEPGGHVVPFARQAIDRAAEAALTEPGIPGREDFLAMAAMARMVSLSPLAPRHLRGEPYSAFMVLLTARDLGISATYAIRKIVPIEGVPSIPPELQRALVRRKHLGDIEPAETNDTQAVPMSASARAVYPDGSHGPWATFTWQDAQIAGLVDPDCQSPLAHEVDGEQIGGHVLKDVPAKGGGKRKGCYCKDNWLRYPRRMLWQRVQGYVTRDHFPEATLGLYTADELGAITDEDGLAIDVASAELPPGYVDEQAERQQRQAQTQAQAEQLADPAALWDLQVRIRALPDGIREQLRERWHAEQSNLRGVSTLRVPARLIRNASAMVNAHEAEAKRGGLDLDAARAELFADVVATMVANFGIPMATGPAEGPEPAGGPDPAPEPAEAADGDQGAGSDAGEPQPATPAAPDPEAEDFREQMANVAKAVRAECEGVPDETISQITLDVKHLHHAKVNTELEAAGRPTSGPIDMRRMEVCLLRLRAWKAEQQAGPEHGPDFAGDDIDPEVCEHGAAMGYCTDGDRPHAEPF